MYLIVDPDGITALCLSKELEKTGMRGFTAKTTEEAQSILNRFPISALITETMCAGIDGVILAAHVVAKGGKTAAFTIGKPMPSDMGRFERFFRKPFADISEIVNYIRQA